MRLRFLIGLSLGVVAWGQSLIVGIPSADVVHKGELMLAFEGQYNRLRSGNYFNSFGFSAFGVGKNTELAASLYGFSLPGSGNRSIGFGAKHVIPLGEHDRWEKHLFVGGMVPFSFDGQGVGYWGYGGVSARIPKARTRITAGPSVGTKQIFGTAGGRNNLHAMVGIEQPMTKHWSIVTDWYSGTHELAAGIFALSWQPDKKSMVIFGWKVPNNAKSGKPALMVEVTKIFGGPKG